jgi:hypothetical protein
VQLPGRNVRFPVELTVLVLRIHRKEARKVAKLARAFAALDRDAGTIRPSPRRATRASLGA